MGRSAGGGVGGVSKRQQRRGKKTRDAAFASEAATASAATAAVRPVAAPAGGFRHSVQAGELGPVDRPATGELQPSVALPIMFGLMRRGPGAEGGAVKAALVDHEAAATIHRFLRNGIALRRERKRAEISPGAAGEGWLPGGSDRKRRRTNRSPSAVGEATPPIFGKGGGSKMAKGCAFPTRSEPWSPQSPSTTAGPYLGIERRHWVLRSLLGSSLQVRRAASSVLLNGVRYWDDYKFRQDNRDLQEDKSAPSSTPSDTVASTASLPAKVVANATPADGSRLTLALLGIASSELFPMRDVASSGRRGHGISAGGDPAIQLLGLLSHLVIDETALHAQCYSLGGMLSDGEGAPSAEDTVFARQMDVISRDRCIESFVASGGLHWAAACLLQLAVKLTGRVAWGMDDERNESETSLNYHAAEAEIDTLQVRTILLTDLLYRLVLYANLSPCSYLSDWSAFSRTKPESECLAKNSKNQPKPGDSITTPVLATTTEEEGWKKSSSDLNKARQRRRQEALSKVHQLLWSSEIPALAVSVKEKSDCAINLTPLACILASYELLRTSSESKETGLPSMSGRSRELDRAILFLGRLVDVSAGVVVDLPASPEPASETRKRGGDVAGASSIGSAGHRRRKRSQLNLLSSIEASGSPSRQSAFGGSLASSLLFGSSPDGRASSSAIARSVSAAMSALDRVRPNRSARHMSDQSHSIAIDVDEEIQSDIEQSHDADAENADDDSDDDNEDGDEDGDFRFDEDTADGDEEKDEEGDDEINSDEDEVDDDDDDDDDPDEDDHDDDGNSIQNAFDSSNIMLLEDEASDDEVMEHLETSTVATPQSMLSKVSKVRNVPFVSKTAPSKDDKRRAYLKSSMTLLEAQYCRHFQNSHQNHPYQRSLNRSLLFGYSALSPPFLTMGAEQSLLKSMCNIIRPPKKPFNLKLFLRRAPTQEEFFRGNLSQNPLSLAQLSKNSNTIAGGTNSGTGGSSSDAESHDHTVRDLRDHIAKDLQMSDSAEMLELLVANKILDLKLKLRVVSQVLWKEHVLDNATTAPPSGSGAFSELSSLLSGSGQHMIQAGSGLAMVFSTSGLGRRSNNESSATSSSALQAAMAKSLPPMVVTYRLIGVDGEATEDHVEVNDLVDPEAPQDTESSDAAYRDKMEKEYGVTRHMTKGHGINILLKSVESDLSIWLKKIRRDNLSHIREGQKSKNRSRDRFVKRLAHPALLLLQHCAKLPSNRKLMVKARAPTLLLRMLLDVLNAIDEPRASVSKGEEGSNKNNTSSRSCPSAGNNPTADALQGLIELLASDISVAADKVVSKRKAPKGGRRRSGSLDSSDLFGDNDDAQNEEGETTMPLLLSSLRSTSLSPPLRKIVAKLLPFLTYGQVRQSRELAAQFVHYVDLDKESGATDSMAGSKDRVLTETFVEAAINLPAVEVCDTLRTELIRQGFVDTITSFLLRDVPLRPPPWSPALFGKSYLDDPISNRTSGKRTQASNEKKEKERFEKKWKAYFQRSRLATSMRILISLATQHAPTQSLITRVSTKGSSGGSTKKESVSLLQALHWMESTSDKASANIALADLGLQAETLLDALQADNETGTSRIGSIRKKTRERKQEIALERRNRALLGMGSFSTLAGSGHAASANGSQKSPQSQHGSRSASVIAKVGGARAPSNSKRRVSNGAAALSASTSTASVSVKPSWLAEMEAMEDETGLTCVVCQEGNKLQPSELLGLYVYMTKVSIPYNKCGGRGDVDGTLMLLSLPALLPSTLRGGEIERDWFQPARDTAESLRKTTHGATTLAAAAAAASSSVTTARPSHYVTTVTAGNAIHCTCHARARTADRNHAKAPKREWEGASLRNSRVTCNSILPLVSSRSSKVSLIDVDQALAEHQTVMINLLGTRPKSILWTVLHDIRLLLLRVACGEPLGDECGGGSLASNSSLVFYMLVTADMYAKDAALDAPEIAQHARNLDLGFLAASEIIKAQDFTRAGASSQRLCRGFADGAPMACLCSILFHNLEVDIKSMPLGSGDSTTPHRKRRWQMNKEKFLFGLMRCAGRRHSHNVKSSGCFSSRGSLRRMRSTSFASWDDEGDEDDGPAFSSSESVEGAGSILDQQGTPGLSDYSSAVRPMVVLYCIFDRISADFVVSMSDEHIEQASERLVAVINKCTRAENIDDLISIADITVDQDLLLKEFLNGASL